MNKANPNTIIVDRKKKRYRYGFDVQWDKEDVLGIEQAKRNHAREITVSSNSDNIIEKFIYNNDHKMLLGKKVWCIKSDNSRMFEGRIVDVLPSKHLLIRVSGVKLPMPMTFKSVISMGD